MAARRLVRAELLARDGRAVAAGRTAALLRGWQLLHEPTGVHLAVPHGWRSGPAGVHLTRTRELRSEMLELPGLAPYPVARSIDVVLDLVHRLPRTAAVVALDSALRAEDVTQDEVADAMARRPSSVRARRALELSDPRSGSVLETVTRLRMIDAGITGFRSQRVIRRNGRYVLRVDFCFEAQRLVVEVDGSRWHQNPTKDRRLDNALVAAGWRVLRHTWDEIMHDWPHVLGEILASLEGTVVHQVA